MPPPTLACDCGAAMQLVVLARVLASWAKGHGSLSVSGGSYCVCAVAWCLWSAVCVRELHDSDTRRALSASYRACCTRGEARRKHLCSAVFAHRSGSSSLYTMWSVCWAAGLLLRAGAACWTYLGNVYVYTIENSPEK